MCTQADVLRRDKQAPKKAKAEIRHKYLYMVHRLIPKAQSSLVRD